MYAVTKDIPPPEKKMGRPAKYPFGQMDVGDSVFLPGEDSHSIGVRAFRVFCSRKGWKGRQRVEKGGVRVWRLS